MACLVVYFENTNPLLHENKILNKKEFIFMACHWIEGRIRIMLFSQENWEWWNKECLIHNSSAIHPAKFSVGGQFGWMSVTLTTSNFERKPIHKLTFLDNFSETHSVSKFKIQDPACQKNQSKTDFWDEGLKKI